MINNKYATLVDKLIDSTRENCLFWKKSSVKNGFCVDISSYQVEILKLSFGSFSIQGERKENYQISIINEDGEYIDTQNINPTDEDYLKVTNLYIDARRAFYNVDDVVQLLIDELH